MSPQACSHRASEPASRRKGSFSQLSPSLRLWPKCHRAGQKQSQRSQGVDQERKRDGAGDDGRGRPEADDTKPLSNCTCTDRPICFHHISLLYAAISISSQSILSSYHHPSIRRGGSLTERRREKERECVCSSVRERNRGLARPLHTASRNSIAIPTSPLQSVHTIHPALPHPPPHPPKPFHFSNPGHPPPSFKSSYTNSQPTLPSERRLHSCSAACLIARVFPPSLPACLTSTQPASQPAYGVHTHRIVTPQFSIFSRVTSLPAAETSRTIALLSVCVCLVAIFHARATPHPPLPSPPQPVQPSIPGSIHTAPTYFPYLLPTICIHTSLPGLPVCSSALLYNNYRFPAVASPPSFYPPARLDASSMVLGCLNE